jgi:hypothetical protein
VLPTISETQLVMISIILLLCGTGIGFILGSLWMEQKLKWRYASQLKHLPQPRQKSHDRIRLSA